MNTQANESSPTFVDTVIIGGGITGLAAAYQFSQNGLSRRDGRMDPGIREEDRSPSTLLLEASPHFGGKLRSEQVDTESAPFLLEHGPDSFVAMKKAATELAHQLGLQDQIIGTNDHQRNIFILKNGRLKKMPDGMMMMVPTKIWPFIASTLLGPMTKLRMAMDLFVKKTKESDISLSQFIRRRFGSGALEYLAEPLLAGFLNAEPERQSVRATLPRLWAMEQKHGSLLKGMLRGLKQRKESSASGFLSFREGMETLPISLKKSLDESPNITLCPNTKVERIQKLDDGTFKIKLDGDSFVFAKEVIITTPAPTASKLLFLVVPTVAAKLRAIRATASGSTYVAYKKEDIPSDLKGFGLVIPRREKRPINAITWVSSKLDGRAPEGHALLRVFFGGSKTPRMMEKMDAERNAIIKEQLCSIMGIKAKPLFMKTFLWQSAQHQYDVGHIDLVREIRSNLPKNMHLIGSAYDGGGISDCIEQANKLRIQLHEIS